MEGHGGVRPDMEGLDYRRTSIFGGGEGTEDARTIEDT